MAFIDKTRDDTGSFTDITRQSSGTINQQELSIGAYRLLIGVGRLLVIRPQVSTDPWTDITREAV